MSYSDQKFFMLAISIFPVKQHFRVKGIHADKVRVAFFMPLAA